MFNFTFPTSLADLNAVASDAVNSVAKAATDNPVVAAVAGTAVVGLASVQVYNMVAPTLEGFAKDAKAKIHEWTAEPVHVTRKVSVSPAAAQAA